MFYAIMDGSKQYDFLNAFIVLLVSILLVFAVLLVIIGVSHLVSILINKETNKDNENNIVEKKQNNTNIEDEDMMVAVLTASIDYRNEIKKDVKLVNVRRID